MRRLSNLVTELAAADSTTALTFTNPREGWVFLSWQGGDASLDGEPLEAHAFDGSNEAMRFLPEGDHELAGPGSLSDVAIRAVPELSFCKYQYDPHIAEFGPYDWAFLERHVLPHVNTVIASGGAAQLDAAREWKRRGGRWFVERGLPAPLKEPADASVIAAAVASMLLDDPTDPDGVLLDEFFGGEHASYPAYAEAARMLARDERLRGKSVRPYHGGHYPETNDWEVGNPDDPANSGHFFGTCLDAGWSFAWERYLQERGYPEDALTYFEDRLRDSMRMWRAFRPDAQRNTVVALGYMTHTETLNIHPDVDYKVFMDMQFQYLATQPEFDGLGGILEYTCGYADEETVRWAARLYRHYGIEGNTELLSDTLGWRYRPGIIRNPDFARHWESWEFPIVDIERNLNVRSIEGYSDLQGRWNRTAAGDTFLTMRRSMECPNTVSQPLRNLVAGQWYSAKLITGDLQDLQAGRSVAREHAVRVILEGDVEVDAERSFQAVVPNNYSHTLPPFDAEHRYYFNWHVVIFRATGTDARLTISDWLSDDAPGGPGGPVGQELMYNFVEVQPYWNG